MNFSRNPIIIPAAQNIFPSSYVKSGISTHANTTFSSFSPL